MNEMGLVCKWFDIARNDLIAAKHLFEDLYPRQVNISCYHAQQAAEKALKGFLQYKKTEPPKTHNLVLLCQRCVSFNPVFSEIMNACTMLTPYSVITRYPNSIELLESEADIAIQYAAKIYNLSASQIPELDFTD